MTNPTKCYACIILIALALTTLPSVFGVGLRPAEVEEYWEPGLSKYVNLKIQNPEGRNMKVTAYAKGELADYISFPSQIIDVKADETEKVFSYRIELPSQLERKGELKTEIIIIAIPEKDPGYTQISANTELVSTLRLMVPYDEKYVETRLFVPKMEYGKETNLMIDMQNHGTKDVQRAIGVVDIYNGMNQKVLVLKSEEVSLWAGEKKSLIIPYAPALENGVYKAKLTVIYDGKNAVDERSFTVGGPEVVVDYISVDTFTLGGIAKFDIIVESKWNELIPEMFGMVSVMGSGGKVYTSYKTSTMEIEPFGKQTLDAYWNTDSVKAGKYTLKVDLFYLDRTTSYQDEITVTPTEIRMAGSPVGQVVRGGEGADATGAILNSQMLLIVIILMLGAFVGIYAYNSFRKKK